MFNKLPFLPTLAAGAAGSAAGALAGALPAFFYKSKNNIINKL